MIDSEKSSDINNNKNEQAMLSSINNQQPESKKANPLLKIKPTININSINNNNNDKKSNNKNKNRNSLSQDDKKTNLLSVLFKAKLQRVLTEEKKVIKEATKTNLEKIIEILLEIKAKEDDDVTIKKLTWAISKLHYGNLYECEPSYDEEEDCSTEKVDFFSEVKDIYKNFALTPNNVSDKKIVFHCKSNTRYDGAYSNINYLDNEDNKDKKDYVNYKTSYNPSYNFFGEGAVKMLDYYNRDGYQCDYSSGGFFVNKNKSNSSNNSNNIVGADSNNNDFNSNRNSNYRRNNNNAYSTSNGIIYFRNSTAHEREIKRMFSIAAINSKTDSIAKLVNLNKENNIVNNNNKDSSEIIRISYDDGIKDAETEDRNINSVEVNRKFSFNVNVLKENKPVDIDDSKNQNNIANIDNNANTNIKLDIKEENNTLQMSNNSYISSINDINNQDNQVLNDEETKLDIKKNNIPIPYDDTYLNINKNTKNNVSEDTNKNIICSNSNTKNLPSPITKTPTQIQIKRMFKSLNNSPQKGLKAPESVKNETINNTQPTVILSTLKKRPKGILSSIGNNDIINNEIELKHKKIFESYNLETLQNLTNEVIVENDINTNTITNNSNSHKKSNSLYKTKTFTNTTIPKNKVLINSNNNNNNSNTNKSNISHTRIQEDYYTTGELHPLLQSQLNQISSKAFNIFNFKKQQGRKNVLKLIYYSTLQNLTPNYFEEIDKDKLNNFATYIYKGYRRDVTYHNDLHGADLNQVTSVWLDSIITKALKLNELDVFSLLTSCVIHDFKHPGLNNTFQINYCTNIALTFNDVSVLENYHVSEAFKLISGVSNISNYGNSNKNIQGGYNGYNGYSGNGTIDCNFLGFLNKDELKYFRKRVIGCVLATDMANHNKVVSNVKTKIDIRSIKGKESGDSNYITNENEEQRINKLSEILLEDSNNNKKLFDDQQDVLNCLIHLADLAHNSKSFNISYKWSILLYEEFFNQGDIEKETGREVSFLCDRNTTNINSAQVGFIKFVIIPSFDLLVNLIPDTKYYFENVCENLKSWERRVEEDKNKEKIQ